MDDLKEYIDELCEKHNAVILAHNYQRPEVQNIAHIIGDSLELSIKASETEADVIVFCGVHFMAETASILCPDKKILLPVISAGCPMAAMVSSEELKEEKLKNPGAVVISYINTTAEVKAESDICCTSANVVNVVKSVDPGRPILMIPDRNLARFAASLCSNENRNIKWWDGYCPIHDALDFENAKKVKEANPFAMFIAHPECKPEVLALADAVRSTSGMFRYIAESEVDEFIVGTEIGVLHQMKLRFPHKTFISVNQDMVCRDMKKTTLKDVVNAFETMSTEIKVPEDIRLKAYSAVKKMQEIK